MTISRKLEIIIGIALFIMLCIVGKIAYDEHEAVAKAQAVSDANQVKIAQYDLLIKQRDAADIQQQAVAVQAQAKIKTSADAVQVITKYVTVPVPASTAPTIVPATPAAVVINKDELAQAVVDKLPPSPSYTLETQAMSVQTAKQLIACDADQKSLTACKADLADSSAAMAAEKSKSDTWEQAAKGGTKTQRFLKVLKCAGLAGGGAAIVSAAGQSKWAGLGAVAGVVGCQLF